MNTHYGFIEDTAGDLRNCTIHCTMRTCPPPWSWLAVWVLALTRSTHFSTQTSRSTRQSMLLNFQRIQCPSVFGRFPRTPLSRRSPWFIPLSLGLLSLEDPSVFSLASRSWPFGRELRIVLRIRRTSKKTELMCNIDRWNKQLYKTVVYLLSLQAGFFGSFWSFRLGSTALGGKWTKDDHWMTYPPSP